MDIKFSNDLFLGLPELNHFKSAMKSNGFVRLFKQSISSYGVVKSTDDTQFDSLKVITAGAGQIAVKSGKAVDKNVDVISIEDTQSDSLSIPSDGIDRYVVISFNPTVIEKGTVDILTNGSLVGTGTQFTSRLTSGNIFSSKIKFPNSALNTREYEIQAVQSDVLASLNIAQGLILQESNVEYSIVGSFTPGKTIPEADKYPLVSDGYTIELKLTDSVDQDLQFVLAKVSYDGSNTSIVDLRNNSVFSVFDQDTLQITKTNPIIGIESCKFGV